MKSHEDPKGMPIGQTIKLRLGEERAGLSCRVMMGGETLESGLFPEFLPLVYTGTQDTFRMTSVYTLRRPDAPRVVGGGQSQRALCESHRPDLCADGHP